MKPFIHRLIEKNIRKTLERGKSILLIGPRQTGKTTLIEQQIKPDISYSFSHTGTKLRYEQDPSLLERELEEKLKSYTKPPIIFIDEVQKIPAVMDIAQYIIDKGLAQFILSGSSARKLKTAKDINLLPGRVVSLHMTPLLYEEMAFLHPNLEDILLYGTLPGIWNVPDPESREIDLYSYVSTYLEEEIRKEALVRHVGHFSRFLQIAAGEAGYQLNFTRLSQDIGVADTTIANYYQILEDCLLVSRIDPLTNAHTKRRLVKSPKYLFFDLGVRRACAGDGIGMPRKLMANLFEHYVGNELVYRGLLDYPSARVRYWRDTAGPEVDYILELNGKYIPIEVKWSDAPNAHDTRHLKKFMEEYPQKAEKGYIVCQTPHRYKINNDILALPWQELDFIFIEADKV